MGVSKIDLDKLFGDRRIVQGDYIGRKFAFRSMRSSVGIARGASKANRQALRRAVGNAWCWQINLIESFGTYLTDQGLKVAVLAVDPVLLKWVIQIVIKHAWTGCRATQMHLFDRLVNRTRRCSRARGCCNLRRLGLTLY